MNKRARADTYQVDLAHAADGPADIQKVVQPCPEYFCKSRIYWIPEYPYNSPRAVSPPGPKLLEAYVISEDGQDKDDVLYRVLALYGIGRDWCGSLYAYRALLDARNVGGTMHMVFLKDPGTPARFDIESARKIEALDQVFNPPNTAATEELEQRKSAFFKRCNGLCGGTAYSN